MEAVPDHWKPRLASALAAAIRESRQVLGSEPIVCLDIGCFPWHGGFELSALTTTEFAADPAVMGPREVACVEDSIVRRYPCRQLSYLR